MKFRIMSAFTAWALLAAAAGLAHGHGSYHDLLAALDQELAARPADSMLLKRRAALHVEHEDWKAALVDLELAERQGAPAGELHFLRGQALVLGGLPEQAEEVLASYVAAHPDDSAAHAVHARALLALERHAEGLEAYRTALRLTTEPSEELVQQAATAFAAHDALPEAIELLRSACASPATTPALLAQSLECELKAGNFDAALDRVAALEKMPPRPEPWMARRARILAQTGRAAEAQAAWSRLRAHLQALPALERGTPLLAALDAEASRALGTAVPAPVIAPPAPLPSPPTAPPSLNPAPPHPPKNP